MLSMIVADAGRGVDIALRYPAFYQAMQDDPFVRRAYEEALELLVCSRRDELDPLPEPPDRRLGFLQRATVQPRLSVEGERWRVSWRPTSVQLAHLSTDDPISHRRDWTESAWQPIFLTEVMAPDCQFVVTLEAGLINKRPFPFPLLVTPALVVSPGATGQSPPAMQVYLKWDKASHTLMLEGAGRLTFPTRPLPLMPDQHGTPVVQPLYLYLEPA